MSNQPEPPPFEVDLHLGGGHVVSFKIFEDGLLKSRNPQVAMLARECGRENMREAAVMVAERSLLKNREDPLYVDDSGVLWIIPTGTVMAMRFRDPTVVGKPSAFGFSSDRFALPGDETAAD